MLSKQWLYCHVPARAPGGNKTFFKDFTRFSNFEMDYFVQPKNKCMGLLLVFKQHKKKKKKKSLFCLPLSEGAKGFVFWGNGLLICFNKGFFNNPKLLKAIHASLLSLHLIII